VEQASDSAVQSAPDITTTTTTIIIITIITGIIYWGYGYDLQQSG